MSAAEPNRQIRTHTCFSYCKTGNDRDFLGDDRPDCIDIQKPEERDKIVCLYPENTDMGETCETTSVAGQMVLGDPANNYVFSPTIAIYAILLANPLQLLWDFLAVLLMKWKVQKGDVVE